MRRRSGPVDRREARCTPYCERQPCARYRATPLGGTDRACHVGAPARESAPSFLSDYVGTEDSFRQHLDDGHYVLRLRTVCDNPSEVRKIAPEEVWPDLPSRVASVNSVHIKGKLPKDTALWTIGPVKSGSVIWR
jgi:hypothetical protein